MSKKIQITCKGQKYVSISNLKNFQGDLKELSKKEFNKLKKSIIKYGFSFPVFVWNDLILDGHQRVYVVLEMMKNGYTINDIPIVEIDAENEKEASEKLLLASSGYAKITNEGLYEYLSVKDLDALILKDVLDLPTVDMDKFIAGYIDDEPKEISDVAPRPFGDERDEISMYDLLQSVDLVKISFSGGKDSVATALYVHNHYKIPKNKILLEHYYNPFEWSDIGEYCKYFAETFGGCFGVELKTYGEDGAKEFMIEKIKEKGLPSVTNKWCFEKYKQRVFGKVAREYKKLGINYIQAVGIRAAESPRRSKMLTQGIIRDVQPYCYPIFDLSDKEVFQMPIQHNIKLHHAYRYFSRTGCPFCPMCPAKEFLILKQEYPEVWDRALELFLYSLECDFYRKMDNNRAKEDLEKIMGIGAEKSRKTDWVPPVGLEFWGC